MVTDYEFKLTMGAYQLRPAFFVKSVSETVVAHSG
jgi:hypothetical protein